MDTNEPLAQIRPQILSANAYLGAFPLAEALDTGADVVVSGRCTDTALTLAPMVHRFRWTAGDYNRLAAGTIAGHLIECGAQGTGGNSQVNWQNMLDLANIGYPIIEAEPDGTFSITKHPKTGGLINTDVIKEQLLYELGDPRAYMTADCVADFTTIRLEDSGPDRVRATGIRGGPAPATLKLSIAYSAGWKAIGTLVYTWPQALEKAQAADRIVRQRLRQLGLKLDEICTEYFGVNACLGPAAPPNPDPPEVQLRIGVRSPERDAVDRFTREMIPLVLSGPPGATGYGEGRPVVREIVAYWPALLPREEIRTEVRLLES
jgi:hypothetical protein